MKRRSFINTSAAASVGLLAGGTAKANMATTPSSELKGNINHSACFWCYNPIPLDTFLQNLKSIGVKAIDLVGPEDFPLLKKHGIHASMCWGAGKGIVEGWNAPGLHEELIKDYKEKIPIIADAGFTNLICFSGNRNGMDDDEGLKNCVKGLEQILPLAEKHGVVIQMELLNSKVNHKDYMCDHTDWGVELCKQLNSDNFKLLYDIYSTCQRNA